MTFFGHDNHLFERVLYIIYAVIAAILCFIQCYKLQKLKTLPVYILPFVSFCMCYVNVILYRGQHIPEFGDAVQAGLVFHACIAPALLIIVFELPYRLHEARSAHFCCISFEQGPYMPVCTSLLILWTIRILAAGGICANVISDFDHFHDERDAAGRGGYAALVGREQSAHMWFSVITPMFVSGLSLYVSIILQRYGKNFTLGIRNNNRFWRLLLPCSILYGVGHCFGTQYFLVTSNAGNIALNIGITVTVLLMQRDLAVAGSFADFLHRSNLAFSLSKDAVQQEIMNHERPEATEEKLNEEPVHENNVELTVVSDRNAEKV